MNRPRPAYVEERIALERARREARKTHDPECICGFCLDRAKRAWLLKLILARNASATEEAPF